MNFLLDTNIINYLLRGNGTVRERFDTAAGGFLLSPVVDFEIRRYLLLKQATRNLRQYEALVESWVKLELNHSDWEQAAVWWAELHKKRYLIADADLLIAVHAFANQAALVTKNLRHFEYLDLILIDWTV